MGHAAPLLPGAGGGKRPRRARVYTLVSAAAACVLTVLLTTRRNPPSSRASTLSAASAGSSSHESSNSSSSPLGGAPAAGRPVLIAIMRGGSGQWPFWQAARAGTLSPASAWVERNCSWRARPLECVFTVNQSQAETADGLYHHIPSTHGRRLPPRAHPGQLRFGVSLESPAYYPWLDDACFMEQFDAEATYRSCSQVQNTFHHEFHVDPVTGASRLHEPPLPFAQKVDGAAYLVSNCGARSQRSAVVREWLALGNGSGVLPLHSYGRCDSNRAMAPGETKHALFRRNKFCIAFENSDAHEYVTEKLWDAFAAGCVPVYAGSGAAALALAPDPRALIIFGPRGNVSSVAGLAALLAALAVDEAAYGAMLAWKAKPLSQLSPGYQAYLRASRHTNECGMCRYVAQQREQRTAAVTCLFNETWRAAAGMRPLARERLPCALPPPPHSRRRR